MVSCVMLSLVITACGSSSSTPSTIDADNADFCTAAAAFVQTSNGSHGDTPMVLTDPQAMKSAWANFVEQALQMQKTSPKELSDATAAVVKNTEETQKLYAKYDYNVLTMAKSADATKALQELKADSANNEAAVKITAFMTKNCGVKSNSN